MYQGAPSGCTGLGDFGRGIIVDVFYLLFVVETACGIGQGGQLYHHIGVINNGSQIHFQDIRFDKAIVTLNGQIKQRTVSLRDQVIDQDNLSIWKDDWDLANEPRANVPQRACDYNFHTPTLGIPVGNSDSMPWF